MRTLLLGLLLGAAGGWLAGHSRWTVAETPTKGGAVPTGDWLVLSEDGFIDPHPDAALAVAFEEEVWGASSLDAHALSTAGPLRA